MTKSKYVTCLVLTKDKSRNKLGIMTSINYGEIVHKPGEKPRLNKEKAIADALKEDSSIELLKDGYTFFLANHIVLPEEQK